MDKKKRLGEILKEKSILRGNFKLASGKESDYYIDGRLTTLDSEGLNLIGEIFLEEILTDPEIKTVGGPTMGADPIVGSVLTRAGSSNLDFSGFLVRKEPKDHGTGKLVEGNLDEGDKVAVVEDVITTGGSVLKAIYAIEKEGAVVSRVLVIVDREEGAERKFSELGYNYFSIFKISDLL